MRGEAIWDSVTLWTLPLAGVLLLLNNPLWVYFGLVGGGMYLYFAGRGLSRFLAGWALDSGMLAADWVFLGQSMTSYHTLFLVNGFGVLASCALLAMVPSLIAKPGDSPPLR